MRKLLASWLLLATLAMAQARDCPYSKGNTDFVMMSQGVSGGIAPVEPRLSVIVVKKADGSAVVLTRRPGGKVARGTVKSFQGLVGGLSRVWALPQDEHPGRADPYGRSEELHLHLGARCWQNSPPTGCLRDQPSVTPSETEKATFAQATAEMAALSRLATTPASVEQWAKAMETLQGL